MAASVLLASVSCDILLAHPAGGIGGGQVLVSTDYDRPDYHFIGGRGLGAFGRGAYGYYGGTSM